MSVTPNPPRPSRAQWHPGRQRWIDGAGSEIHGEFPLAQLGVGGQYVDPDPAAKGRVWTIVDIITDAAGRVQVIAH